MIVAAGQAIGKLARCPDCKATARVEVAHTLRSSGNDRLPTPYPPSAVNYAMIHCPKCGRKQVSRGMALELVNSDGT